MRTINLELHKGQVEFLQKRKECRYTLFTGGVGSGKSYTASVAIVLDMMENPNAVIGVFAPTIKHVRDIVMRYVIKRLREFGFEQGKDSHSGDFYVNKNEMKILPNHPQLCEVWFMSLDDPDSIVGFEFYKCHVDELDVVARQFGTQKAEQCWENILARTRQWPEGLDESLMVWSEETGRLEPRQTVSAYSTPEGFKFTYLTWKKNNPNNANYNPEYGYVQARTYDNPHLTREYIRQLEAKYSGQKAKAYLEGEWVNLESGTVYYAYDREAHHSSETIQPNEPLHIGIDFNVGHMSASVFVQRIRESRTEWHCVAEIDDLLDTPDLIQAIKVKWQSKGHRIIAYPDSTGKNRHASNATTNQILELKLAGFEIRARENNPLVTDRVATVNKQFMDHIVYVNDDLCPNRAEFLEQQAYDKSGKPDKNYHGDHGLDSFGYPIAYMFCNRKKLFAVPVTFARKY